MNTVQARNGSSRPLNITFLGAGSSFCPRLCRDVLLISGSSAGQFRLVDTDAERLGLMHSVIERLIRDAGASDRWSVRSTTNRRDLLVGTTCAVCCVEVAGLACVASDNDIALKHGVDQCIGDTVGPGGLFKGLRTIPVFLDILRDMAELCPAAVMLNYTNPMGMMCLAAARAVPEVTVVGLCHSVQGTSRLLAEYAGVAYDEMDWACAGINHLAWFTTLEHHGADLYESVLYEKFRREVAEGLAEAEAGLARHDSADDLPGPGSERKYRHDDLVRKDMCLHFGAFITESSGHLSEYLPYYRKSEAGRRLLRLGYHGGSRFYASNWPTWRQRADDQRRRLAAGEEPVTGERSLEYASWIIQAIERDEPFHFHGNVMNRVADGRLIANLPEDGCVEVECRVDGRGIQPLRFGPLPPQMAHICASNMAMIDLGATAAVTRSKEAAAHALMLDPLCAAICTPGQIWDMTMELFEAEAEFLPGYS